MNSETIENVISKSVMYIKDVEWRGGGGKLGKYMSDLCIIVHILDYNW